MIDDQRVAPTQQMGDSLGLAGAKVRILKMVLERGKEVGHGVGGVKSVIAGGCLEEGVSGANSLRWTWIRFELANPIFGENCNEFR
jgi:hypothetical protein